MTYNSVKENINSGLQEVANIIDILDDRSFVLEVARMYIKYLVQKKHKKYVM